MAPAQYVRAPFFVYIHIALWGLVRGTYIRWGMVCGMKNHRRPEKLMTAGGNINRDRTGLA